MRKGKGMFDFYTLRKNRVHRFQPKVKVFSEKGPYLLKTVETSRELTEALRLRYQVFHREMIGKRKSRGVDVDEFDFICDHLVIIDQKTEKIVGTYRMNSSLFSNRFYSANEFNIRKLIELPGNKLELGRACIHKDYRHGIVISLLWRGIAEYMQKTNSDILFGCASLQTQCAKSAALLYRYFASFDRLVDQFSCPPTFSYQSSELEKHISEMQGPMTNEEILVAENLMPALCRAYLKAGATFSGIPAYDEEFKCFDFLTILKRDRLHQALWRKYEAPKGNAISA